MRPFLPILPFLAKYPFLRVADRFLKFEFGDVDLDSDEEPVSTARKLGIEIVEHVLEGKEHPVFEEVRKIRFDFLCDECEVKECREKAKDEFEVFVYCTYPARDINLKRVEGLARKMVLAYVFSRIAVSKLSEAQRRKFAVREARRYREMLEDEGEGFLKYLANDLGIGVKVRDDVFKVDVADYLRGAVRIKADAWKLVNRWLDGGYVFLSKREFVRLIEEYLRRRLEEKVGLDARISVRVREKWDEEIRGMGVRVECYPPCMKRILADLNRGVNVPHTARFAIASFLLNIGMGVDDVVRIFRNAPDFDEEKTRYQVEHIAGMRGKGEEYVCPSCETMRSYGNCYPDEGCEGVGHPIRYYRRCVTRTCSR